jgi:putative transposase
MARCRRNFIPGGCYFFTVTLADRRTSVLVDYEDALRQAFPARGVNAAPDVAARA